MSTAGLVILLVMFVAFGYGFAKQAGVVNMLTRMSVGALVIAVSFASNAGESPETTLNASLVITYGLAAILIVTKGRPIDFGDPWAWNDERKVPLPPATPDEQRRHIRRTGVQFIGCWCLLSLTLIPLALAGY